MNEYAEIQIKELFDIIIKKLDGGKLYGESIDLNNPKHLVVGAYLYGWAMEHGSREEVYKVLEDFRR